jgi:tetratricopeptide (TPR) repeat protein
VKFRKPAPHEAYRKFIEPGNDEFPEEREAMQIESTLARFEVPLAPDFEGASPLPDGYSKPVRHGLVSTSDAVYHSSAGDFTTGLAAWKKSLGEIRRAQFYALPGNRVRYEIASSKPLAYRVGEWHMEWMDGKLRRFRPISESLATAEKPLFADVTGNLLGGQVQFEAQLTRGIPYWRARLDSATGIDIYGSNGIAVGDIDNDGWDEIYVCQPGGLVNRLYRRSPEGQLIDITYESGLDVLDDTSSALFVDFRNAGVQDLVVLCSSGPLYFANDGRGKFTHRTDAFRFATTPQGTFTGMAAADYDRDGRVDLYLCTYVYFQSEDRYRYPVPYHDAQNGPPNYLFRNVADGVFEDVTASTGINENNNRYSFAPAWSDYDNSGWPSLYVANDFGRKNLYKNTGGKFHDIAADAGAEDIGPGMSAAWFDADNDGRPDLYVANMWAPSGQRVSASPNFPPVRDGHLVEAYRRHSKGNSFYRNRGDGKFDELPVALEMGHWAWCSDGIDFDNDGTPEVLVTAGMLTNSNPVDMMSFFWRQTVAKSPVTNTPSPAYENGWNALNQFIREDYSWNGNEPNVVFLRDGERYRDISGISGFDFAADSRAFAAIDIDGDGILDLALKSRLGPQLRVLRNESIADTNVVVLTLRGTKSNRDAIGARVDAEANGKRITRWISAGNGYLSQHTKSVHLPAVEQLTVSWPSGLSQSFTGLRAGRHYLLTEGSPDITSNPLLPRAAMRPAAALEPDNAPRLHETWLVEPVPLPIRRNKAGFLLLTTGAERRPLKPTDLPWEVLDLSTANPDDAAALALFRRYLLDWRADLQLPLLLLTDAQGRVHKIYPDVPEVSHLFADLKALGTPDEHPIPFHGRYYNGRPSRNYYRFGAAFVAAGYPDQALPYLREAVRQWPENWKAHLAIGQVHLEQNRAAEAQPELELAARLNPRSPEVWNNLGGVAAARQDHAAALGYYEKALALNPDLPWVLSNAGQAQANLNRPAEAEKLYRRALKLDSKDTDTPDRLGLLLAQQGRYDEAQTLFQQAIANDRQNASAINNLGVLYKQTGKDNDALAAFLYGMEVAPEDENIAMNLARLYYGAGDREKAKLALERHLEKRPDSPRARRALAELQK